MLEKPDLPDDQITECLHTAYGLTGLRLAFLPLGADANTAVYRAVTAEGTAYFVKLRGGSFNESTVTLPRYLRDHGMPSVIAPLPAKSGQLWADLGAYKVILYPFVEGRDGYAVALSASHWAGLGAALKTLHTTALPPRLLSRLQRESYTPRWRARVRSFATRAAQGGDDDDDVDAVAAEVVELIQNRREQLLDLADRAERLAATLQAHPPEFVLCHSDLHAGNVLIAHDGALFIVDWDDPILAPKERDLMYAGGGQGFSGHTPAEEEAHFYEGYGPAEINQAALAYYRYERIIQDIAIYCEQLLLTAAGGQDRAQSLRYLKSNFEPDGVLEIAYRSDKTRRPGSA
jgi:spectinomycin phosphotransferase